MITETLTLPNLFTSIRCLADDPNKYLQEAVFAHYCMECGQVFLARFDEYSCGMSYMRRWKGEYYKCPNCGKESIDTYDETKFWNTVAYEKKPGKYVPKTLELTLQEFKEKIRLDIKGECIAIDPEHPAWAKKANVRESITFDIRKQKTWFKQFIGKESGEAVDITKDIPHQMTHFAPAYYDLHIFKKDEQPQTIQHCITMPSYVDFIVNDIINDNGETIELQIQSNTSDYYKCDDNYYAYATIDKHYHLKMSTFVFSRRSSERSCPSEEINQITHRNKYQYVATVDTNSESITPEEALQESKKRYQQQ